MAIKSKVQSRATVALKHTRVLQNMVEYGGNSGRRGGISQAARAVGYSEAYIKSGKLQKTKAWKELVTEAFPDEEVATLHRQQLYAQTIKQMPFFYKMKDAEIQTLIESQGFTFISTKRFMNTAYVSFAVPDYITRDKALDKVYKLKNRYNSTVTLHNEFTKRTDKEIEHEIAETMAEAIAAILDDKDAVKELQRL